MGSLCSQTPERRYRSLKALRHNSKVELPNIFLDTQSRRAGLVNHLSSGVISVPGAP